MNNNATKPGAAAHCTSHRGPSDVWPGGVTVRAPSRLHFGILALGSPGRQFGGAGVMIDSPGLQLRAQRSGALSARGPLAERALRFARDWARFHRLQQEPPCCIEIENVSPQHVGLGVGTQLGLAVATALNSLFGIAQPAPIDLAASVGRGRRSAIGVYGFLHGGLIVEPGKLAGEALAPLSCRVDVPTHWRFVLIRPNEPAGLAGAQEVDAFAQLPPIARETTEQLISELRQNLLPAAAAANFDEFSESLYRYGRLSGECFRAVQGGAYNGPLLSELVECVRKLGVRGVGQSSWGPTLFAVTRDPEQSDDLTHRLRRQAPSAGLEINTAAANNTGAAITSE